MFNKKEINEIEDTLEDIEDRIFELGDFMYYYIDKEIKNTIEEYGIEIDVVNAPNLSYSTIYTLNGIEVYKGLIRDIYDLKEFINKIKEVKNIEDNTIKNLNK